MYSRVAELKNLVVSSLDGDIGRCRDFLFDDEHWTVRFIELNTSRWLLGRRVLISPATVGTPDFAHKRLPVELTRQAIEDAPGLEADQPVSRQYEAEYARHFGQMYYWWGAGLWGSGAVPGDIVTRGELPAETALEDVNSIESDNHLRSAHEVIGYRTHATDGDLGSVKDFVLDTNTWSIDFVVLDTGQWLPGRKIVLPVAWVTGIDWAERRFNVDVTRAQLETAPELDEPLSAQGIVAFYAHFGRVVDAPGSG